MKTRYRSEIDGLRAIAVGAVILYHAQISFSGFKIFKGGFIGVDIFFLISGYLITSIILNEIIKTGSFSFKYFYERRVRRILPALIFVMVASFPFAWIYLVPSHLVEFSKSILYSLGFSSNFFFHFSGQIYGALDGLFKPFLHTWSLSVEEQYYIFFPVILIIIFKYFRIYLIHTLIIGFIISLILAEWTSRNYPSISFYFIHTRMWELLAGSILAYFDITKIHNKKDKFLSSTLTLFGFSLIVYSLLFFDDKILHPSLYTLVPILGVCLIIWFSNKNHLIIKILSSNLFVGVGLISYSLYLWHYPVFAFIKISGLVSGSIISKLYLIPTLFCLSIFSYYYIEKPFRDKKISFKKIILYLTISFITLIILNLKIIEENGFATRFGYLKKINENYNPDNIFLGQMSMKKSATNIEDFNINYLNIIIIGDSHAVDLYNSLKLNNNLFKNYRFYLIQDKPFNISNNLNKKILKQSNVLILSYRWDEEILQQLNKNIDEIKNINNKIIITSRTNEYKIYSKLYTLLDKIVLFEKKKFDYFGLKKLYFDNRIIHSSSEINKKLKQFASEENLNFLNKEDYMCEIKKQECDYIDTIGNKLFYDYGHYTKSGAYYFGKKIYEINWLKIN